MFTNHQLLTCDIEFPSFGYAMAYIQVSVLDQRLEQMDAALWWTAAPKMIHCSIEECFCRLSSVGKSPQMVPKESE
jgi:hypothetical protein